MDCPIQSPLTTHEGMWRIYSNPDHYGRGGGIEQQAPSIGHRQNMINIVVYKMTKITNSIFNLISPIRITYQRMGVHGPLNISEVGLGVMEE
jgi:hypothetical protein